MKIHVYAFQFDHKVQPPQYPHVFNWMQEKSGAAFSDEIQFAVTSKREGAGREWWMGVLLRYRDAKTMTVLRENKITMENLLGDGKVLEATFFILNKETGRGLYSHNRGGITVTSFGAICDSIHQKLQEQKRKSASNKETFGGKKKRKHAEALGFEQLFRPGNFVEQVKEFKKVKTVEVALANISTISTFFRGIGVHTRRSKMVMTLEDGISPTAIAEELDKLFKGKIAENQITEVKASGNLEKGVDFSAYWVKGSADRFAQYDYDEAFKDMVIDLSSRDNLEASLRSSAMLKRLFTVASSPHVENLLMLK